MLFMLNAGHGGSDPGATYKGRKESDDNLRLCFKIKEYLEQFGHKAIMSRAADTNATIAAAVKMANDNKCDYFLSVHRNSFNESAKGFEVWVHSQVSTATYNKAKTLLDEIEKVSEADTNRGIKKGAPSYTDFAVNIGTNMPSCLLELLFISNPNDNALFDKHFNDYARAIATGLIKAMGGKITEPKAPLADEVVNAEVKSLKEALSVASVNIGQLKAQILNRDSTINSLNSRLNELGSKIENAKKALM